MKNMVIEITITMKAKRRREVRTTRRQNPPNSPSSLGRREKAKRKDGPEMNSTPLSETMELSGPARLRAQFFPRHKIGLSDVSRVLGLSVSRISRRRRIGTLNLRIRQDECGKFFVLIDDLVNYLYPTNEPSLPMSPPVKKRPGRPRKFTEGGGR